ncbi:permease prefix domain 1-containing protein [Actinomadura macra]|uniref:permease prefix domain 1-containing protein n=1 Tax=Actinomadura macra TaxID=46164 RepID=UPI00082B6D5E|nr:permease prefix domain 1-containing protein [Actinomadura macra]
MTHHPIDELVTALTAELQGPARLKARMLDEVRDGLTDAAADLAHDGAPEDEAVRQAVREFGAVEEIAPVFQRELTIAQARHTARAVALTVPALLGCWYLVETTGQGRHLPGPVQLLAAHLGGVAALTALLAAASLAATGALARRLPVPDRLPLVMAWTGTTACVALAISALTLTGASIMATDWPLTLLIGALTIVAHARIAASARACRRCARLPGIPPAISPLYG